jgi:hypothetical protein
LPTIGSGLASSNGSILGARPKPQCSRDNPNPEKYEEAFMTQKTQGKKKILSAVICTLFVASSLISGLFLRSPLASATTLDHDVGNVDIKMLTDFGRVLQTVNWGQAQTARDPMGFGFMGLVIDQDNYNHLPGAEDIADCFTAFPYATSDDFIIVNTLNMVIDDGTTQKSVAAFQNEGVGTNDPFDILVNQTAWTVKDKDWAILQWTLTNIRSPASTLTGVCIGLEIPFSKDGARYGVGGNLNDGGDDVDGYDSVEQVYWVSDTDSGVSMGVGSAISADPITHYYAQDYHSDYSSEYTNFFADETWLYNRLHAPSQTATDGISPGNVTTTVGWNGETIGPGESRTFTMVFALNDTHGNMMTAMDDARNYYYKVASGFRITEFSDSDSIPQRIEIFNYGNKPTDMAADGFFLSVDGGTTALVGTWDKNPLPTYDHGVFTVTGGTIGPEGDTLGLYQDLGGGNIILMEQVFFGLEGTTPDPLGGESASRRYDPVATIYTDEWLRNASSGPTWGTQNNVPSINTVPDVILNEVMFNPGAPELGFVELMYIGSATLDIQGYNIVCDREYRVPTSQILSPANPYFTLRQSDDPSFFSIMDSIGDNVYLYDNNGILMDMVGWNSPHLPKMSVSRIPEGFGTYQGFDDASSQAAGWFFNTPLDVLLTEISDSGSATSQIEVYNPAYPPIDFSSGFSFNSLSGPLSGSWSIPVAPTNGYALFDVTTLMGLDPEGDTLSFFQSGSLIEEISYGLYGTIPDPQDDESAGRFWDSPLMEYTNFWSKNASLGPTWGAQNDIPAENFLSEVVLNEVLFNPGMPDLGFAELYYTGGGSVDISGYKIVCDDEYNIPQGTAIDSADRYFILLYSDYSAFFNNMNPSGDNVYLYDDSGSLIDMVGWSSSHMINTSVVRVPNGTGGRKGYDDTSSQLEGWIFDSIPSPQLIALIPNQFQIGISGMTLTYILNVTNKNSFDDVMDISFSSLRGWPVVLLQSDTITLLTDTESGPEADGIPDTGLIPPKSTVQFAVNVSIPFGIPGGISEYTTVMATSSVNSFAHDSALLNTSTLMGLEYRAPNRYVTFVRGTIMVIGHVDGTQVKLTDIANGNLLNQFPIDSGEIWTTNLVDSHVDVNATNNVTVLSGNSFYASGGNSWMSYIPTQSGSKYGTTFYGFVPQEIYLFVPTLSAQPATSISITDLTDGDDTQVLTSANADFVNSDVEIYRLTTFDDDAVMITSNVQISVMAGKVSNGVDWTVTPPSVNGSEKGMRYFVFASESLTVLPLEDNTNVIITDLSDGDDSRTLTMNRFDIYSQRSSSEFGNPVVARPGTTYYHNSNNLIDDDYIEIVSDKDILVYIGPVCDQRQEFADLSPSVSTGIFSQEVFTYAQNGGANDLQVFVYDKEHTIVKITSLTYSWAPGSGRDTFFDFTLDTDDFSGVGPWWWEWGGWGGNILHIQSNLPVSVFNGDFDGASFGSFLSVINPPEHILYPDLLIEPADISFVPSSVIIKGEPVDIFATIHNVGDLNVTDVKVSFYQGDPLLGGTLISSNQTIPFLDVGESITLNITWIPPTAGSYSIYVAIDHPAPGFIVEFDETNNIASKVLWVMAISPPEPFIQAVGDDIVLNWTLSDPFGVSHFLIYRATSQIGFDFLSPWVDTSGILANGTDPLDGLVIPKRSTWNDTGSASQSAEKEYYYTIRTVYLTGEISHTSRSVGKVTWVFSPGISTFSLPLEPFTPYDAESYCQDMNAQYIRWMDPGGYIWLKHDKGGVTNNTQIEMGIGYEGYFSSQTKYTFCGMPGAMIQYDNISFGFDTTSSGEAQSLHAQVNSASDTVVLSWRQPANMGSGDSYQVLRSSNRYGFWGIFGTDYEELTLLPHDTFFHLDSGIATAGSEYYYMIVPLNQSTMERGTGSYSVGVWTTDILNSYHTFGLPLKPHGYNLTDWYCDKIQFAVGINFFNSSYQIWYWHATSMPEGAFDTLIEMGEGYQISISSPTKFSFVGI